MYNTIKEIEESKYLTKRQKEIQIVIYQFAEGQLSEEAVEEELEKIFKKKKNNYDL